MEESKAIAKFVVGKTVRNSGQFVSGDPRSGRGKRGRSGRKPEAFKRLCRSLASSADVMASVEMILQQPNHPAFVGALKWATENGYGKAPNVAVGVFGAGHDRQLTVVIKKE